MARPAVSRGADRRAIEPRRWWRRSLVALVIGIVAFIALSGWFDRSSERVVDLGSPDQLLLVNSAGPVRVRTADADNDPPGITLTQFDSWLGRRPQLETESSATGAVARITCPSRFPCRSSVELLVPAGIELVIVSTEGLVEVSRFEGSVTIYASGEGAVLGPVSGSVRVVSDGSVRGFDLTISEMNVLVGQGEIDLSFARSPSALTVDGAAEPVRLVLPNQRFNLDVSSTSSEPVVDVRTSDTANRVIVVRTDGPVSVVNP